MLTPENFEIVYINLESATLKDATMDQYLKNLGLPYDRVSGELYTDPTDEFVTATIDRNFKDHTGRNITLGEFGCFMSHLKVWQRAIELNRTLLVLEDDAKASRCIPDTQREILWVRSILNSTEYDFCYLGRQALQPEKEDRVEVYRGLIKPRYSWLTHAYMITPEGAEKMIEYFMNHSIIPVDEAIPYMIGRGGDKYVMREYPYLPEHLRLKALAHIDDNLFYQDRKGESVTETTGRIMSHGIDPSSLVVKLVTCATDMQHPGFVTLFKSLQLYGWNLELCYNIGHDVEWSGGDMIAPGGGHKITLLKKEFEDGLFDDEDIIIFLDGYDTAVMDSPYNIVRRWLDNFDPEMVVFGAERVCWPDESMAEKFDEIYSKDTPYRYLNSGTFIGKAKNIRKIINAAEIAEGDDDQLYYQQQFFKEPEIWERDGYLMFIDFECRIFQCMYTSEDDLEYDPVDNKVYNKVTRTRPQVIHGNGYAKESLNILMSNVESFWYPGVFQRMI